jgi:purine nucleosidase
VSDPFPVPIVIDTDIGADPDDALALTLAVASPEIDLRGVTIVSGHVHWRARMAARLLGMAGRTDVLIFAGVGESLDPHRGAAWTGREEVGLLDAPHNGDEATIQTEPAVDWLISESRRRPFHLVAIGPLTNVALAMVRDPDFANRLLGLTVMGGLLDAGTMPAAWQEAIRERGSAAWPDFNTTSDPAAALTVARAGVPITWIPLDVTMRAPLRVAARERLSAAHPLSAALGRMIDAWHAGWFPAALPAGFDRDPVPSDAVALLHDPLALSALFPGDWLQLRPARLVSTIEDGVFRLREDVAGAPAAIAARVDGARFEAFLMARIVRLLGR